MSNITHGL